MTGGNRFIAACRDGKLQKVKKAISEGVDVDITGEKDLDRKTPLILATEGGHDDIVSLLIANHAMVDGQDRYGTISKSKAFLFVDSSNLIFEYQQSLQFAINRNFIWSTGNTPMHWAAIKVLH